VERSSIRTFGEPRHVKLVFSNRGGVKYRWLSAYIEVLMQQSRDGTLVLPKRDIKHRVLHPKLIQIVPHRLSAGAQLADAVASAFFSAAHTLGTRWNLKPAEHLKQCMATETGFHFDYGVALQPTPAYRAGLTTNQMKIFEFYGYDFRR
jgi:hypothetical protein